MERLRDAVTIVKGKARILDFKQADEEWLHNTNPLKSPNFGVAEGGERGKSGDAESTDHGDVFDQDGLALIPEITRERVSVLLNNGAVVFSVADDEEFSDGLLWRMTPDLACLLGVRLLLLARKSGADISFIWKRPLE